MHERVTDALDALGLLLVAAGATAAAWRLVGPAGLAVGGAVTLAGSWLAAWQAGRQATRHGKGEGDQ